MKKFTRFLSALLVVMLLVPMLPAALAEADEDVYKRQGHGYAICALL